MDVNRKLHRTENAIGNPGNAGHRTTSAEANNENWNLTNPSYSPSRSAQRGFFVSKPNRGPNFRNRASLVRHQQLHRLIQHRRATSHQSPALRAKFKKSPFTPIRHEYYESTTNTNTRCPTRSTVNAQGESPTPKLSKQVQAKYSREMWNKTTETGLRFAASLKFKIRSTNSTGGCKSLIPKLVIQRPRIQLCLFPHTFAQSYIQRASVPQNCFTNHHESRHYIHHLWQRWTISMASTTAEIL